MVHISEVAHAYVSDIHEHLSEGQTVQVMVIAADQTGKINLSIKRTQQPPERTAERRPPRPQHGTRPRSESFRPSPLKTPKGPQSFDDMVKQFMQDSDSKISSLKQYSDHKSRSRRR